ncbi:MAG: DUF370 domain-containing protein [Heliobacteriaceae bacterium]|nr:DUF370 domain-containing protein [Heliobacteriaceae bacterium]MDD4587691.1 DUF370 domain-containing protein [Heliobacteriaceae bacterium]
MYLHLGDEVVIPTTEIIAIVAWSAPAQAAATRALVFAAREKGYLRRIAPKGKEKAVVVSRNNVYLSPISALTLMKRANNIKY